VRQRFDEVGRCRRGGGRVGHKGEHIFVAILESPLATGTTPTVQNSSLSTEMKVMKVIDRSACRAAVVLLVAAGLAACGTMAPGGLPAGTPIAEVRNSPIGPSGEYPLPGGGTRLEFRQGRQTYMLDFDAAGLLVSSQQVLTPEMFATITLGMTQEEVLARIGRPVHVVGIGWQERQLWSYRFSGLESTCVVFQVAIANATHTVADAGQNMDPACNGPNSRF
jgi:hypothetical protein